MDSGPSGLAPKLSGLPPEPFMMEGEGYLDIHGPTLTFWGPGPVLDLGPGLDWDRSRSWVQSQSRVQSWSRIRSWPWVWVPDLGLIPTPGLVLGPVPVPGLVLAPVPVPALGLVPVLWSP